MNPLAILGLIAAVGVLVVGAYKGVGAFAITLAAAAVVCLTNGINLWQGLATNYMGGYTSAYAGFLLLFSASSLYAKFMDVSGSATAIGFQFIDWFGKKRVMLVCTLIISVLTYGGVSLFVVVYAVAPIMFLLFKEADLPRHLTMACLITGACTYTMTALPGTPSLTNVIPTGFLNTTLTAAPLFGIVASIAMFVMAMAYMNWAEKKARANGERWTYPDNVDPSLYEVKDRSVLPSSAKAFAPLIVLMIIIVVGSRMTMENPAGVGDPVPMFNSTMLAVCAMLVSTVLTFALNADKFKGISLKSVISGGLEGGIDGIGGYAGVVAFGAVVQNTVAFTQIVEWVLSLGMNPYVQAVVATCVICAVTGSSSGGQRIMYTALTPSFLASGANLEVLHRLTSISADWLDTLPHSPGLFLMFAMLGLTHKDGYKHVFICSTIVPGIVTIVATALAVAGVLG
jgi:H+/gluconate symporter and related permeases